jgi:hypothetical protein
MPRPLGGRPSNVCSNDSRSSDICYTTINLPEKRASRWGEALTAEKMNQCRWKNS